MRRRALLAAAGLLVAGAGAPRQAFAQREPKMMIDGMVGLRIFQAAIEGHVNDILRGLRIAAASRGADSGVWSDISPTLAQLTEASAIRPICWLARPDGTYVSTFDNAPAPDNLTVHPFFKDLLAGREVEGATLISGVSGQRVIVMAAPIVRRGVVTGAVGAEFSARAVMAGAHAFYQLPPDLLFIVFNDAGMIVLHSESDRIFQTPDLSEASMASAIARIITEDSGTVAYRARGVGRLAVFSRSRRLGWRFVLAQTTR